MRNWYLKRKHPDGGCRGGVGIQDNQYTSGYDYEVEIGGSAHCSSEMMALMVHYDEIMEFVRTSNSSFGGLLWSSLRRTKEDIETSVLGVKIDTGETEMSDALPRLTPDEQRDQLLLTESLTSCSESEVDTGETNE